VLANGAVDVTVSWGEPIAYDMNADRKQIARAAEASVRRMTAQALRSARPATGQVARPVLSSSPVAEII
jgi:lyso-ornithine lipid O-acyltransferase